MKNSTLFILFFLTTLLFLTTFTSFGQSTAIYTVTFNSVWNDPDHGTLPNNAHWSRLVGATHNSDVSYLQIGQIASAGIEMVAEEGNNAIFNSEVNTSIVDGNANQYIFGNALSTATGNIIITDLQVAEDFPLLTLVSMIAPSPDWMIAIIGLNLRDENGWKSSIVVDLFGYDAGTDSGTNYDSENFDTNPKQPISSLQNVAPFNSEKVGTITVQLESVLELEDHVAVDDIKIYPNPSKGLITLSNIQNIDLETISVYNILGSLMKRFETLSTSNQQVLNLNDLNKGIYVIIIATSDGQSKTQKLILE